MKPIRRRLLARAALVAGAACARGAAPALAASLPGAAQQAPEPEVPVYATRLPPPVRESYTLKRGLLTGLGQFVWQVGDGRYEARLEGSVGGMNVLDWISRGTIDGAGIAPERFVVRRLGRGTQTADFERGSGKITFSASAAVHPLLPGAQDRLSWMIQLPAIVAARPERFAAGARIVLYVAGARGDVNLWTFTVSGPERVKLPDGRVEAIKLVREPERPQDTRVVIWLDPRRHYLPARATMADKGRDADFELLREGR